MAPFYTYLCLPFRCQFLHIPSYHISLVYQSKHVRCLNKINPCCYQHQNDDTINNLPQLELGEGLAKSDQEHYEGVAEITSSGN